MSQKSKTTFCTDNVLESFYEILHQLAYTRTPERVIERVHIPMSDVFYVREAIKSTTGIDYGLDHVEWAMMKEGYLKPSDCYKGRERMRCNTYEESLLCKE